MIAGLLRNKGYDLTKKTGTEYSTACPFCGGVDRFCVWPEKDRYWCRQCNKSGDSIQLLQDLDGMTFKEAKEYLKIGGNGERPQKRPSANSIKGNKPFIHPKLGKGVKHWIYPDENGKALFATVRFNVIKNGKKDKTLRPCKLDGLTWNLDGVRLVLYNLPEVIKSETIFMAEGEKCVDALTSLGVTATTSPMGAGKWPKLEDEHEIGKPLHGKTVYILPDNDDPGKKHVEDIARSLYKKVQVFILELPGLPVKGDICNYIDKHGPEKTANDLVSLAAKAKPWKPPSNFFTVEDLLSIKYDHHTPIIGSGIMPYGSHIIIAGESGVGKSLLRMELSVYLVMGWDWLGFKVPTARRIAIFQYENTEHMEQVRLKKMCQGLGIERLPKKSINYVDRKNRLNLPLKRDRTKLEELVKESEAEVICYDCLSNFHTSDENKNIAMREILDTFTEINTKVGTSCIVIHHFGKPTEGQKNRYRTRGAQSIMDWAVTAMGFMAKAHESRILRIFEFFKVRDGAIPKPMLLERDENFLLNQVEEDTLCPPAKVREILESLGGEVEKQSQLVEAIMNETDCSPRSAQSFIRHAVEMKTITEKSNGIRGHAKGYFIKS